VVGLTEKGKGVEIRPVQNNSLKSLFPTARLSLCMCFVIHFCLIYQWPTIIRADNVNINEVGLAPLNFLQFELKGQVQLTGFGFLFGYSV
jgi:hypothetical protein